MGCVKSTSLASKEKEQSMISLTTLPLFLTAACALNIAPGPDMLYVMAKSARQGRLVGLSSAPGNWLKMHAHASRIVNWLTGGIFIGLGVRIALLKRQ